jgi:lipopolysaccharide transport system ATP-binding protein
MSVPAQLEPTASAAALSAEGLTKVYRLYARPLDRLREALGGGRRHAELRALDSVSFTLPRGEGLGIIGENGAGKSTLLKILCGVTQPTAGALRVNGRVAGILELGAGFHPEFTGRQNAVLNAALLGLSESDVAAALPRILDFSELGDFIDRPVKTYSTGMAMRLAFSIATQIEPDVLIVDEALSVGDGYFQKKCLDRLLAFIRGGGTVLFCSHAMYYVTALCRHALWLRQGRVERFGPALDVVHAYEEHLAARDAARSGEGRRAAAAADERGPARLAGVRWLSDNAPVEGATRSFASGDPWGVAVEWQSDEPSRRFHLAVAVDRADGVQVFTFATHQDGLAPSTGSNRHCLAVRVEELPIVKGEFTLYVFLLDEEGLHVFDQAVYHGAFRVDAESYRTGLLALRHSWSADDRPSAALRASSAAAAPLAEARG